MLPSECRRVLELRILKVLALVGTPNFLVLLDIRKRLARVGGRASEAYFVSPPHA